MMADWVRASEMVHFPLEDASQAADKAHKHFASGYGDHLSLFGTPVALPVRLYHVVSYTILCLRTLWLYSPEAEMLSLWIHAMIQSWILHHAGTVINP